MGFPDVYTGIAWAVAILAFLLGVQVLGVTTALVVAILILVGLVAFSWGAGRRVREGRSRREPRFRPTDEVFRDPSSGQLTRVYVDPRTGERRYMDE
jgi:divalent metal cation (Fe/Co/Zn/Cd) transporter